MAEETNKEGITTGTTGNGYLTKPYLVRNLQIFWGKIKTYFNKKIEPLASKDFVRGQLDGKADASDLESLTTTVDGKIDQNALNEALATKVNVDGDKVLSENDFTDVLKTKLENLPDSAATTSDSGLMSANDKIKLDSIAEGATRVTVDSEWNSESENPAQSKVISAELAKKADKEDDPSDPSDLIRLSSITSYATDEGHIVLNFIRDTEHLKVYTPNSDRPIEKVSLRDQNETLFTNFKKTDNDTLAITIENPEGKKDENSWKINAYTSFNFYIENLTVENKKYKPFILEAKRIDEEDLTKIQLDIIKVFES